MVCYDADVLFNYITHTNDIRDPLTREPLALHEQMRLQRVCENVLLQSKTSSYFVRWWLSISDDNDVSPIRIEH